MIEKLNEYTEEQYLGIEVKIESKFSAWDMKEVAELQQFCIQPRRKWTVKADVVNERDVDGVGGTLVAAYPPHVLA